VYTTILIHPKKNYVASGWFGPGWFPTGCVSFGPKVLRGNFLHLGQIRPSNVWKVVVLLESAIFGPSTEQIRWWKNPIFWRIPKNSEKSENMNKFPINFFFMIR